MTIPNVTMRWCQRESTCNFCHGKIEAGDPMIVVFFWNKGGDGRRWNVKQFYHVVTQVEGYDYHCWEMQGLDYLKRNPYTAITRDRKPKLSKEDTRQRKLILNRKAALDQRKRKLDPTRPDYLQKITQIDADIIVLGSEILKYGKMPDKWLQEILNN